MRDSIKKRIKSLNSGRFRTYCTIVLLMTLVLLGYSFIIIGQLRADTIANNRRFTEYFKTALANNLNGISDFAYNILQSNYSTQLISEKQEDPEKNRIMDNAAGLRHEMFMYKNSNRLIGDIIEYFPGLDIMVGNNGYYSPFVYYKSGSGFWLNMSSSQEKFQLWMNSLFSDKRAGFYYINDLNGIPTVFYYCSVPNPLDEKERRTVVVQLSQKGLREILQELVVEGGYELAVITDAEGVVYAHYGEIPGFSADDAFDGAAVKSGYSVFQTNSSLLGLNCITVQEKNAAYKIISMVSVTLMIGIALTIAVGVTFAVYYAEKNRRDIYKIAALFEIGQEDTPTLDSIGKQIDAMIANNRAVVDEAERQQRIVDSSFLRELLIRKGMTADEITLLSTLYNEEIENDTFLLTVIRHERDNTVNHSALYALITQAEQEGFRIYYTDFMRSLIFLCNFDSDSENGKINQLTDRILQDAASIGITETCVFTSAPVVSMVEVLQQWERMRKQASWPAEEPDGKAENAADDNEKYTDATVLAHKIAVEEYNNSQLSLQLVAERVGVSQAYLSRVFKQKYGMSVMRYINYLRIDEAKRLITSGSEPLKVIALKVGFISDINLIRVFKKFESITPGLYREKEER